MKYTEKTKVRLRPGVIVDGFSHGRVYSIFYNSGVGVFGPGYYAQGDTSTARLQDTEGNCTGHGNYNFEPVTNSIKRNLPSWW